MTQPTIIRRAQEKDWPTLARFNAAMALETEGVTLDPERVSAGVRALLGFPVRGRYYLAERSGVPVGQLMTTTEWSDWRNGDFWWIQSVYVEPEARRTGVYSALYAHVLEAAKADPTICGIRLYVHHHNARAIATYEALGMDRADYQMYEVDFVLQR